MIDSTTDLPKEEPETVIEKLTNAAILALLLAACATGPSATTPAQWEAEAAQESRTPSNSTDARPYDVEGEADRGANPENAATGPGDVTPPDEADEPSEDESAKSNDEPTDDEGHAKPKRTVLKTVYDDRRVGEDQRAAIEAELGLVEDEALLEYIRSVGIRLLRYAPPRPFDYEFKIVDQRVPNAFALPGGKIYVSRGLLALVQSEDELAGVIGHEITHAAERHAAARIDYSRRINPFAIGYLRAGRLAAYGRDQERDADRGGQIMAARAGYNPVGIATFLRKLDAADRYEIGWSRLPHFLSTHPTSPSRSALASERASGLTWERQPGVAGDHTSAYYAVIDGLILGDNPAGGLFEDTRFVHPDLKFAIRFPQGWTTFNTQQAVGAVSPGRDAEATLTVEGEGPDIAKVVDAFVAKEEDGGHISVRERRRIKLGDLPAIRIEGSVGGAFGGLYAQMTFVAHGGLVYRLSVISLKGARSKYRGRARAFAHSFRPLDEAGVYSLKVTRLRVARALGNETLQALATRTHNELELVYTGLMNNLYAESSLEKGQPVKIGLAEPYIPKPKDETTVEPREGNDAEPEAH